MNSFAIPEEIVEPNICLSDKPCDALLKFFWNQSKYSLETGVRIHHIQLKTTKET